MLFRSVKTKDETRFYSLLTEVASAGIVVEGIAPADDDAGSVYEYLIGEEATR